ncbi:MAG: hypothetical protein U9N53_09125 [Bacteroidota bacterium]|nr:hypothetical protein [Bacteroidota bacterium]
MHKYLPHYHQGRITDTEKRVKELARERENLNARIDLAESKLEK